MIGVIAVEATTRARDQRREHGESILDESIQCTPFECIWLVHVCKRSEAASRLVLECKGEALAHLCRVAMLGSAEPLKEPRLVHGEDGIEKLARAPGGDAGRLQ